MGCRASTAVAVRPTSFAQVVPDDLPPPCRRKADGLPDEASQSNLNSQRKKCFDQQLKYAIDQVVSDQQEQAEGALEQAGGDSEQARGASSSLGQAPAPDLPVPVEAEEQVLGDSRPEEQPPAMWPFNGVPRQSPSKEASEQRGQQPEHHEGEGRQQSKKQRPREDREPERSEKMMSEAPLGDKEFGTGEKMMTKVDTMKSASVPVDANRRQVCDLVADDLRMVSEPKGLVTYQSYNYDPTAEDFAAGHPIASCGPSHRRHLRRLRKYLKSLVNFPQSFNDKVAARRQKMDERRKRQDAVPDKSPVVDLLQDEASAEAGARGRPDSKAKPSQILEPIQDDSMPQVA